MSTRSRLEELERRIAPSLQTYIEVGLSLNEIRDEQLYKPEFATFVQYGNARWQFAQRCADLSAAAK